jgi:hypothetical protein
VVRDIGQIPFYRVLSSVICVENYKLRK